ncbi:MAG TPA: Nif3-like dinuclear metal center hexameric protein [Myxococcota bacterium]|jgi:putative NIF3 family GTP cyclohydrolase 1 type 2
MKTTSRDDLVKALDGYFHVDAAVEDGWETIFGVVYETPHWRPFVEPKWAQCWNGLMLRGADEVVRVATCVFPSDEIIARLAPGTFLFTEHPLDDAAGDVFAPWSRASFERMKRDGISVYVVHAPLDHHPDVSPSALLARSLGLTSCESYLPTARGIAGGSAVIGETDLDTARLAARLQSVLGAEIPVRTVSSTKPANHRVAIVAGGGGEVAALDASLERGCTTYITGNAASPCHIPFVRAIHDAFRRRADEAGIVVIDGTHYGTEKPAQLAMLDWFRARGIDAQFEAGRPERD